MPVQMPSLDDMFKAYGNFPTTYMQAQNQYDSQANLANQFSNTELQDEQRKLGYNQKADPFRLDQMMLENQTKRAQLPGVDAQAQGQVQDWRNRQAVGPALEQDAMRQKMLSQISDEDLKQVENHIQKLAVSTDPQERAAGLAAMPNLKEFQKQRELLQNAVKTTGMNNATSIRVAEINAAGRLAAKQAGQGAKDFMTRYALLKEPRQQLSALQAEIARAGTDSEPDTSYINTLSAMKDAITQTAGAQLSNAGKLQPEYYTKPDGTLGIKMSTQQSKVDLGGKPQETKPTQGPDSATFIKAFGSYDPANYEYRMGPNGVPQRRKK